MQPDSKSHWEDVYRSKAPDAVSWYAPHLERSLALIRRCAPDPSSAVVDVGGGESTLVDDLLSIGYRDVAVLDISGAAIEVAKRRLGPLASRVTWIEADITSVELPVERWDVWHDRAVFHFLTGRAQREAYVRQVARATRRGGHVIVATFGPEGPTKCSGLDVVRYDAARLHREFGRGFEMVEHATELHRTPFGSTQQFLYCYCKLA